MDIRITYDDAYYKDDDKFIICIKNLSINEVLNTIYLQLGEYIHV